MTTAPVEKDFSTSLFEVDSDCLIGCCVPCVPYASILTRYDNLLNGRAKSEPIYDAVVAVYAVLVCVGIPCFVQVCDSILLLFVRDSLGLTSDSKLKLPGTSTRIGSIEIRYPGYSYRGFTTYMLLFTVRAWASLARACDWGSDGPKCLIAWFHWYCNLFRWGFGPAILFFIRCRGWDDDGEDEDDMTQICANVCEWTAF